MKARLIAAYVGLCLLWGSAWTATRVVTDEVPALRASALRFGLGALVLAVVYGAGLLRHRRDRSPLRGPLGTAGLQASAVLGLTMFAGPTALVVWASDRVSGGTMLLVFAGLPLATAAMVPLMKGARTPRAVLQCALLGAGGIALTLQSALHGSWSEIPGVTALVLAVLLQAGSLVYAKSLVNANSRDYADSRGYAKTSLVGLNLAGSVAVQLAVGAVALGGLSAVTERGARWPASTDGLGALILLGVVGAGVAYPLYYWMLGRMEPWKVATMAWVQTLVTLAEGAILLREGVTLSMGLGAAVVFASIGMMLRASPGDDLPVTLKVTGDADGG